jgi:hypothetical protein
VPIPTVPDVDAIAAIPDPVLRNLRITHCYHELARAVAQRVAPGANWCTFATWASRQAGQTIRGEDFARAADSVFGTPEVRALLERAIALADRRVMASAVAPLVTEVRRIIDPAAALRRSAAAVAAGNLKVFHEIAREFARWLATAAAAGPPDQAATSAFCAALRPGEPPEGQRLLGEAFAAYGDACHAQEPDARAERLLLANLLVGFHEQTRLQPEIASALNAAIDEETRGRLLALFLPGPWLRVRASVARMIGRPLPLDRAIDDLLAAVRRELRLVLTHALMTLRVPGAVLRLGSDVPGGFPAELRRVDHPSLRALLARVDPTPDSAVGSGARDWANLAQRMHFITDFFRTWHARAELFEAPFAPAQVDEMLAGRVPHGGL